MIARFVGGSMGGKTGHVFDEVPQTWNVPVPLDHGLDILDTTDSLSWIDVTAPKVDTYALDGWYVRWSNGERIPIYLFKGSS